MVEGEGGLFCHPCYTKDRQVAEKEGTTLRFEQAFQARSKSLGPGDTSAIKGGGESCPRCGGAVFHAEKVLLPLAIGVMIIIGNIVMMIMAVFHPVNSLLAANDIFV